MKTSFKKLCFIQVSCFCPAFLSYKQGFTVGTRKRPVCAVCQSFVSNFGCGYSAAGLPAEKEKNTYTEEQITGLILSMGIFMRVVYLLYTPLTVRSHDLWGIDLSSGGHASYLLLAMQGMLPPDNYLQFYQQPLYYFAGAFFQSCKTDFSAVRKRIIWWMRPGRFPVPRPASVC